MVALDWDIQGQYIVLWRQQHKGAEQDEKQQCPSCLSYSGKKNQREIFVLVTAHICDPLWRYAWNK